MEKDGSEPGSEPGFEPEFEPRSLIMDANRMTEAMHNYVHRGSMETATRGKRGISRARSMSKTQGLDRDPTSQDRPSSMGFVSGNIFIRFMRRVSTNFRRLPSKCLEAISTN